MIPEMTQQSVFLRKESMEAVKSAVELMALLQGLPKLCFALLKTSNCGRKSSGQNLFPMPG